MRPIREIEEVGKLSEKWMKKRIKKEEKTEMKKKYGRERGEKGKTIKDRISRADKRHNKSLLSKARTIDFVLLVFRN